jgi:hypothetical protein
MNGSEIKCIVTFYGNGWFRRLQMTKDAYVAQNKRNFKAFLNELMEDLGGDHYTYDVIK